MRYGKLNCSTVYSQECMKSAMREATSFSGSLPNRTCYFWWLSASLPRLLNKFFFSDFFILYLLSCAFVLFIGNPLLMELIRFSWVLVTRTTSWAHIPSLFTLTQTLPSRSWLRLSISAVPSWAALPGWAMDLPKWVPLLTSHTCSHWCSSSSVYKS